MNHFIGWKFGVPIQVFSKYAHPTTQEGLLIYEDETTFSTVLSTGALWGFKKCNSHYELIPYRNYDSSPRYPVCVNKENAVYCNAWGKMSALSNLSTKDLVKIPKTAATFTIDGKTIELSAETTAKLKKKLGV